MADIFSNYLKALLYPEDILNTTLAVTRDNFLTVQDFDYCLSRTVDDMGMPYGETNSAVLSVTVRIFRPEQSKFFYGRLLKSQAESFSFLFNTTFKPDQSVDSYEDAMVATGYVVDVKEYFSPSIGDDGKSQQMQLTFKLLITSVDFLGKDHNKHLEIVKDNTDSE